MRKTFCDRCGAEITYESDYIAVTRDISKYHYYGGLSICGKQAATMEVCPRCMAEFLTWSESKTKEDK